MKLATWRTIAVICSVVVVACGGSSTPSSQATSQPISMQVALYPGSLISLPGYIAQQKGFFKANGLDVSLVEVSGGPAAVSALLSNSVQMMLNATDLNMQTSEKGQKIVVAAGDTNHMIFSLIARTDVSTPNQSKGYPAVMTDLKGKKIGVTQRGSSVELFVHVMLKDAGLDPNKDVVFIGVGLPGTALPAMENKQIDAYMAFEPMQTLAVTQKKEAKILVDLRKGEGNALFKEWDYNSWATTSDYASSNKEAIKRFQKAMSQTQDWMHDPKNFNALVQLTAKIQNMDTQTATDMLKGNLDTFGYKMSSQAVTNTSQFLVSNGLLKNQVKYSDYVLPGT